MRAWAAEAFDDRWKALGFVVALETILVLACTEWLVDVALGLLVAINGIATACKLGQAQQSASSHRLRATVTAKKG